MAKCIDDCYFEVEINNWNGGDHTWYTYKIFKNSKNAYDFMRAHQNQICKEGWETTGKVEVKPFEDARTE